MIETQHNVIETQHSIIQTQHNVTSKHNSVFAKHNTIFAKQNSKFSRLRNAECCYTKLKPIILDPVTDPDLQVRGARTPKKIVSVLRASFWPKNNLTYGWRA